MSENFEPKYLLVGCGYTLERVAKSLPIGSYIATVRSDKRANILGKAGIPYRFCNIEDKSSIQKIIAEYPSLKVLVDSAPPIAVADCSLGVKNILASLENSRLERIIYLSTTGVFGVSDGSWVDEKTIAKPDSPKSQARLDCENLYRKSGIASVALRIVGIYGLGRGLGLSIKHKRPIDLGAADRWTNRIHVDDLASFLNFLITYPVDLPLPEILCACDDEPAQVKEVLMHYHNLLGLEYSEMDSDQDSETSITHSRNNLNQRVSNFLLKGMFGKDLKYPSFREGAGTEFSIETEPS